jgi:hypothetical protein
MMTFSACNRLLKSQQPEGKRHKAKGRIQKPSKSAFFAFCLLPSALFLRLPALSGSL